MKKFMAAGLFIIVVVPLGILLAQKNSHDEVPDSFLEKTNSQTQTVPTVPAQPNFTQETINSKEAAEVPLKTGELNTFILNRNALPDKRRQVLQELVAGGPKGLAEMAAIAQSPVPRFPQFKNPHSSDYGYYKFEKGLRITAIETLDQWAVKGTDVMKELTVIRDTENEQDLVFLASLAVSGIQEGHPGKVTRFIDQAFNEALNGK
jgi:hypothetical protein